MVIRRERLVLEVLFTFFLFLWLASEIARLLLILLFPSLRAAEFFLIPILFFDVFFCIEWLLRTNIAISERKFFHYHLHEGGILDIFVFLFPLVLHSIPTLLAWISSRSVFLNPTWTILVSLAVALRLLRLFKLLRLGGNTKRMLTMFLSLLFLVEASNVLVAKALMHSAAKLKAHDEITVESFLLSSVTKVLATAEEGTVIARQFAGKKAMEIEDNSLPRIIPSYLYTKKITEGGVVFLKTSYSTVYLLFSYLYQLLYIVILFIITVCFMFGFRASPKVNREFV